MYQWTLRLDWKMYKKKNDKCKYLKWWRKYGVLHLASCQLTLSRKEAKKLGVKKTNFTIWQSCWVSLFLTANFPLTKRLKIDAALPPLLFHSPQSQFADLISPSKYIYVLIHCSVHPTFVPFVAHSSPSTHPKLYFRFPFSPCSFFPLTVSDVLLLFLQSSALLLSVFYTGRLRRKKLTAAQFSQTCSMVCNFDTNCCENSGTFVQWCIILTHTTVYCKSASFLSIL